MSAKVEVTAYGLALELFIDVQRVHFLDHPVYDTIRYDVDGVNRPEECLSMREALDLYTLGGAYAAMQEHRLGRLLPGYQADFIVLDKDICMSPTDLLSVKVLEVWVGGQRKL